MAKLRPTASGRQASCTAFLRATATPKAALVISAGGEFPSDWPTESRADVSDSQLGHAVGWVCEIRRDDVLLLNPLGEGVFRAPLPRFDDAWIHEVRASASAAVYLLDHEVADSPAAAVDAAAARGPLPAASVRTAVSDTYGQPAPVGRNDPCPCGSGKKYKHCHLK